jgi:small subunit ribosomal protein S7
MNLTTKYTESEYVKIRCACVSLLTRNGYKIRAQRIWDNAMSYISQQNSNVTDVVLNAMEMCTPVVEYRRVRVAGTVVQVPKLMTPKQAQSRGMRWLIEGARRRDNRIYAHALAQEFLDAARGAGWATSQRDEMHRIAEANRAYVRYQWWK